MNAVLCNIYNSLRIITIMMSMPSPCCCESFSYVYGNFSESNWHCSSDLRLECILIVWEWRERKFLDDSLFLKPLFLPLPLRFRHVCVKCDTVSPLQIRLSEVFLFATCLERIGVVIVAQIVKISSLWSNVLNLIVDFLEPTKVAKLHYMSVG